MCRSSSKAPHCPQGPQEEPQAGGARPLLRGQDTGGDAALPSPALPILPWAASSPAASLEACTASGRSAEVSKESAVTTKPLSLEEASARQTSPCSQSLHPKSRPSGPLRPQPRAPAPLTRSLTGTPARPSRRGRLTGQCAAVALGRGKWTPGRTTYVSAV